MILRKLLFYDMLVRKWINLKPITSEWITTYLLTFSNKLKVTTNAYYSYFHRNWYKLNDVRAGITSKEKISIADILIDPETNNALF